MNQTQKKYAPGAPGIPARWTSSAKTGLGTAISRQSRVWFTLSHGIFNEIYYPRIDLTWRFNHKLRSLPPGKILRVETLEPAVIHWIADDWKTCQDIKTLDDGLGIHLADLPTQSLPKGKQIKFTFYWPDAGRWEGKDFTVRIAAWRRENIVSAERNKTNGK